MKKFSLKSKFLIAILFFLVIGLSGCANLRDLIVPGGDPTALDKDKIITAIWNVIKWFSAGAGTVVGICFIYAGIQYMIGLGNEEKLQKAKANLLWSFVGLIVIVLASSAIYYLLHDIMGANP